MKLFIAIFLCFLGIVRADIVPVNRRITWRGNVGVPGGIPQRTARKCIPGPSPIGGAADDGPNIQKAVNAARATKALPKCILFPTGTYRIGRSVRIPPYLTVRGNGMGRTIFLSNATPFSFVGPTRTFSQLISSDLAAGATSMTLNAPLGGFPMVGQYVTISEQNDCQLSFVGPAAEGAPWTERVSVRDAVTTAGSRIVTSASAPFRSAYDVLRRIKSTNADTGPFRQGASGKRYANYIDSVDSPTQITLHYPANISGTDQTFTLVYHRIVSQIVRLTAASRDQRSLTFSPGVYYPMLTALKSKVAIQAATGPDNLLTDSGLEDMTLEHPILPGFTGRATPAQYPLWPKPYARHVEGTYLVHMQYAARCWIKNVEFINPSYVGCFVEQSARCEIRDCYLHDGPSPEGGGGMGYAIQLVNDVTGTLVENNIMDKTETCLVHGGGGMGCVWSYNYIHSSYYGGPTGVIQAEEVVNHYGTPLFTLIEGNIAHKAEADGYHGNVALSTYFRNWFKGHQAELPISQGRRAISLDAYARNISVVGNLLGDSTLGSDSWVFNNPSVSGTTYDKPYVWYIGYATSASNVPKDPGVQKTLIESGNYDCVHQAQTWLDNVPNAAGIPSSYLYDKKPAWWDQYGTLTWPPFDPAAGFPETDKIIPAAKRFFDGPLPGVSQRRTASE